MTIVHPAIRDGFHKENARPNPETARIRAEVANFKLEPPSRRTGAPESPRGPESPRTPASDSPKRTTKREVRAKARAPKGVEREGTRPGVAAHGGPAIEASAPIDERGTKRGHDTMVRALVQQARRTDAAGWKRAAAELRRTRGPAAPPPGSPLVTIGKNARPVDYQRGTHYSGMRAHYDNVPWHRGRGGKNLSTHGKPIRCPESPFNIRVPNNEGVTSIPDDWDHQMRSEVNRARVQVHGYNPGRIEHY